MNPESSRDAAPTADPREDFRAVFERFFPRLRSFFVASGFQPADADDLSQTALLAVYKAREEFRGEGSLDAWVYSIARNVARDEWRRRGRASEIEPLAETIPDPRPAIDDEHEGRHDLARTIAALSKLPTGMRTCLLLHVQQGLPYREIARRLSLSLPTVKVQIWNARRRLRTLLEEEP